MTKKMLLETSSAAPVKAGNRWRAILAVPGQGSSGFYSEAVLREYGPLALAPGAKAFINHDPARNPRDMIGTFPEGAVYEDGVGLVGELDVFPHYKEFVETVGPHAAMSIYMMGEQDGDGNVTALVPDRQNGCDLVSYAGLEGSSLVEKLYESAHKISVGETDTGTATAAAKLTKEQTLEIEELAAKMDSLTESFTALAGVLTPLAESLKPIEVPEVDVAAAIESAVDRANAAGIPKELRGAIREAAKTGGDVDAAIAEQKVVVDSIKATFVQESAPASGYTVTYGADTKFKLTDLAGVN